MKYLISSFSIAIFGFFLFAAPAMAADFVVVDCHDIIGLPLIGSGDTVTLAASFSCNHQIDVFEGTLDGDGFTITLTGNTLINEFRGATIQDVTFAGVINITSTSTGGVANFASSTSVTNVTSSVVMTATTNILDVGGFFGEVVEDIDIISSVFDGSIIYTSATPSSVGGLIGTVAAGSINTITLTGNTVSGAVTATGADLVNEVGGLIGIIEAGDIVANGNSISTDITIAGTSEFRESGGMIGVMEDDTSLLSTNDVLSGTVSSTMLGNISSLGGMVGVMRDRVTVTATGTTLSGDMRLTGPYIDSVAYAGIGENNGGADITFSNISSSKTASFIINTSSMSVSSIGGFLGYSDMLETATTTFTDVSLSGDVVFFAASSTYTSSSLQSYGGYIGKSLGNTSTISITGGIISGDTTLTFNTGSYASQVGNLIGEISGPLNISGTTVHSDITISPLTTTEDITSIGGVVGEFDIIVTSSPITFDDITMTGDITIDTTDYVQNVGGIIGNQGYGTLTFTSSTASGDIHITASDMDDVGGLGGDIEDVQNTTLSDLTYTGEIHIVATTDASYIGGIFGDFDANLAMTATDITMSGSIFATSTGDLSDVGGMFGNMGFGEGNVTTTGFISNASLRLVVASSTDSIGGLAGDIRSFNMWFIDTIVTSDITIITNDDIDYLGGYVGYLDSYGFFENIVYDGSIDIIGGDALDIYDVGGIAGHNESDMTITSSTITLDWTFTSSTEFWDIGGVVGHQDDDEFVCTNCTVGGQITLVGNGVAEDVEAIAGFVAWVEGASSTVNISDSVSTLDMTITVSGDTAEVNAISGILGYIDNSSADVTIENTYYAGDIVIEATGSDTQVYDIGGMFGYTLESGTFTFDTVYTTGNIDITANATSSDIYQIGGIGGSANEDDGILLSNSYSLVGMDLTATASGTAIYDIGGLFGQTVTVAIPTFTQNYYNGAINITAGDSSITDVGGWFGEYAFAQLVATSSYAIVDIDVTIEGDTYRNISYMGGLFGNMNADTIGTNIQDVFVAGTIDVSSVATANTGTGLFNIGGITGQFVSPGEITNAYADVDITIDIADDNSLRNIAPFIGQDALFENITVSDSFAAGALSITSLTAPNNIGGFFGDYNGSTSTNNYFDITRTGQDECSTSTDSVDGCTGVNAANSDSGIFIGNRTAAPISSWDFDEVWQIDADYYPVLAFAPYDGSETIVAAPRTSGGGSYIPPSVPTVEDELTALKIDGGSDTTTDTSVNLTFSEVLNAETVAFSNTLDFSGVSYVPFDTESYSHTLTEGNGIKTVYAKLRSSQGGTLIIKDTINLTGQGFDQTVETTPTSAGASSCPLSVQTAYKTPQSNAIYYVTKDCTKRGFSSADLYFTYFSSWSDAQLTTQTLLNSVTNDTIGFLPLGPRYAPTSGALVKTLFDAKTYLLLQGTLYHIEDELAAEFQFGSTWATWIEGVDERLLQNYPLSTTKLNTTDRLDGMLIKYPNDAKVYQLATESGEQVKRWIPTEAAFQALNFRDDRIVTIPTSESYTDGSDLTS